MGTMELVDSIPDVSGMEVALFGPAAPHVLGVLPHVSPLSFLIWNSLEWGIVVEWV